MKLPACHYAVTFTLSLLFSQVLLSQNVAPPGFYVHQQGDTIKGNFPGFVKAYNNPGQVNFIPANENIPVVLTPANCREFEVSGVASFLAYTGKRMVNPITYNNATTNNEDDAAPVSTFLRRVGEANEVTFYVYRDNKRVNLFYVQDAGLPVELQQKAAIINNSYRESMTYKAQMKALFQTVDAANRIDQLSYTEESFAAFTRKKGDTNPGYKNDFNGFFLLAGLTNNSFNYDGVQSPDFATREYPSNLKPLFGAGYFLSINSKKDRFYLFPQVKVFSYKHTNVLNYNSGTTSFTSTFQAAPVITLGFHLGYNFINQPNLKASIAPGVGATMLVKNKKTDVAVLGPTTTTTNETNINNFSSLVDVQGMLLFKKRYMVWASFNLPTNVANATANTANLSTLQLGVGYKF